MLCVFGGLGLGECVGANERRKFSRVLIVDDHPLFAEALGDMLQSLAPEIETEFAGHLTDAQKRLQIEPLPCLIFFDLGLPDSPVTVSLSKCRELASGIPFVVMSAHDEPVRVRQALQEGALAFLSKSLRPAEIVKVLTVIVDGGKPAAPDHAENDALRNELPLSARQCEVMDCLAAGMSNKEIASRLGVTAGTVKVHLREIFARLDAHNRTEAVALYRANVGKTGR